MWSVKRTSSPATRPIPLASPGAPSGVAFRCAEPSWWSRAAISNDLSVTLQRRVQSWPLDQSRGNKPADIAPSLVTVSSHAAVADDAPPPRGLGPVTMLTHSRDSSALHAGHRTGAAVAASVLPVFAFTTASAHTQGISPQRSLFVFVPCQRPETAAADRRGRKSNQPPGTDGDDAFLTLSYAYFIVPMQPITQHAAVSPGGDRLFLLPAAVSLGEQGTRMEVLSLRAAQDGAVRIATSHAWLTIRSASARAAIRRRRLSGGGDEVDLSTVVCCAQSAASSAGLALVATSVKGAFFSFCPSSGDGSWPCRSLSVIRPFDTVRDPVAGPGADAEQPLVAWSRAGGQVDRPPQPASNTGPSWAFATRWQHSAEFSAALAATAEDEAVLRGYLCVAQSPSRALERLARRGVTVLAQSLGARAQLVRVGGPTRAGGYALCEIPSATALPSDGGRGSARAVPVALCSDDLLIIDAVPVSAAGEGPAAGTAGFVALALQPWKDSRSAGPRGLGDLLSILTSEAGALELHFIAFSGLATVLQTLPVLGSEGPKASVLEAARDAIHQLRIVSVTSVGCGEGMTLAGLFAAHAGRAVHVAIARSDRQAASLSRAAILPDAAFQVGSLLAATDASGPTEGCARLAALVHFSVASDLSACGNSRSSADSAATFALTARVVTAQPLVKFQVMCYENVEGQPQGVSAGPAATQPITPFNEAASVACLLEAIRQLGRRSAARGARTHLLVQLVSAVASSLLQPGSDVWMERNVGLLCDLRSALLGIVEALIGDGDLSSLFAALSFLAGPAESRGAPWHAFWAPLFDAAYPCLAASFPALAEGVIPFCSEAAFGCVTAGRELFLLSRAVTGALPGGARTPVEASSATALLRGVLARVESGADGLLTLTVCETEATAQRLFLENGPHAAAEFLQPFASVSGCNEALGGLYHSYAKLGARLDSLLAG